MMLVMKQSIITLHIFTIIIIIRYTQLLPCIEGPQYPKPSDTYLIYPAILILMRTYKLQSIISTLKMRYMCLTKLNAVSHRAWSENLRQLNKMKLTNSRLLFPKRDIINNKNVTWNNHIIILLNSQRFKATKQIPEFKQPC